MNLPRIVGAAAGHPLAVLGDALRVNLTGADTGGLFALVEQINQPATGLPPHVHTREDETFIVLEGAVEFGLGNDTHVLPPGDLAYAPRGVAHRFTVVSATPARMLVHLAPAGLEAMYAELAALPAGPPDMGHVVQVCGRYGVTLLPSAPAQP